MIDPGNTFNKQIQQQNSTIIKENAITLRMMALTVSLSILSIFISISKILCNTKPNRIVSAIHINTLSMDIKYSTVRSSGRMDAVIKSRQIFQDKAFLVRSFVNLVRE
jgi:hypothetical protein